MELTSCNDRPFQDRPGDLRVQVMEVIDALGGDIIKYTDADGGVICLMPDDLPAQNAIGVFLRKLNLLATGWRDYSDTVGGAYSHAASFELVEG